MNMTIRGHAGDGIQRVDLLKIWDTVDAGMLASLSRRTAFVLLSSDSRVVMPEISSHGSEVVKEL